MKRPSSVLYRRSPYLVLYWADGKLVFENFAARVRVTAEPVTVQILEFLDRWRPIEELVRHLDDYHPSSLIRAVDSLVRHSLLERCDRASKPAERPMQTWEHWNPAAGFFHFSTKDVHRAIDRKMLARELLRRARKWPMPMPIKRYPGARRFALPEPQTRGEFPRVLLARRTWRQFANQPLELGELSTLLGLTWAVQHWIKLRGLGHVAFKTFPSGGALHPTEAYVLALRVAGLPRGLYHYAAHKHELELLRPGAHPSQVNRYLPGQPWYRRAAALVLMTAVFGRTQWKYQFPRAYRAVLIEAGHSCQTFCLVATWLGLAPFCTMALADSRAEKDLGLDGITESVLYVAGVGARPPGVDWAPLPAGLRKVELRRPELPFVP